VVSANLWLINVLNNNNVLCGTVDAQGIHGLVCKQAPSKIARHQAVNDVIAHAITTADVPVTKEPIGLARLDNKRPGWLVGVEFNAPLDTV